MNTTESEAQVSLLKTMMKKYNIDLDLYVKRKSTREEVIFFSIINDILLKESVYKGVYEKCAVKVNTKLPLVQSLANSIMFLNPFILFYNHLDIFNIDINEIGIVHLKLDKLNKIYTYEDVSVYIYNLDSDSMINITDQIKIKRSHFVFSSYFSNVLKDFDEDIILFTGSQSTLISEESLSNIIKKNFTKEDVNIFSIDDRDSKVRIESNSVLYGLKSYTTAEKENYVTYRVYYYDHLSISDYTHLLKLLKKETLDTIKKSFDYLMKIDATNNIFTLNPDDGHYYVTEGFNYMNYKFYYLKLVELLLLLTLKKNITYNFKCNLVTYDKLDKYPDIFNTKNLKKIEEFITVLFKEIEDKIDFIKNE